MTWPVAGSTCPPLVFAPLVLFCAPAALPEPAPVEVVLVAVPVFVVEPVVDPVVDPVVVFAVVPVVVVVEPPVPDDAVAEGEALFDAVGLGLAAPLVPHGPAPCLSQAWGCGAICARRFADGSLATNVGLLQFETDAWLTSTFGSAACNSWIRVKLS